MTIAEEEERTTKLKSNHERHHSSLRLDPNWLRQIAAEVDDEDDDEESDGDDGLIKTKSPPSPPSPDRKKREQEQEVLVLLDKIAFFPLPSDAPNSPITTSNRKRLSLKAGVVPGLPSLSPSTSKEGAATTTTTALAPRMSSSPKQEALQVQQQQQQELLVLPKPEEEKVDNDLIDDDYDDDIDIQSDHSELTAGGIWEDVPMAAPDAILGIAQNYRECTVENKVNVCVGAYRDEHGKPWVLPSVRQAERIMMDEMHEVKEYLPIEGDRDFVECAMRFAYGNEMNMDHLAAVQALSGTGACRVGGAFLARFWPQHPIYIPDPTWGNHITIFRECGLAVRRYRYYNKKTNGLDMTGMLADLKKAPDGSIVLLHACAHNPTGCDPTIDDWKKIVALIRRKEHVVFFDSAYQGFASGNAEQDAQPFRYAVSQHVPILLAQSFAKNFGLYGERVGTLSIVCGDEEQKQHILSELRIIIRPMYSSPPRHGSSIVKTILSSETLEAQYREECAKMADRIQQMRSKLVVALKKAGSTHDWSHITRQIGMFAFTGLNAAMCQRMTKEFFIFLTTNGRISVAGLNDSNVEYVAKAIHAVSDGQAITTA